MKIKYSCSVSLSPKDNRRHQIKEVICENFSNNEFTLLLVPKHPTEPDVTRICKDYNFEAKLDENVLTMSQIKFQEIEGHCVRVKVKDLPSFLEGLENGLAIAKGDYKMILGICNRLKNAQQGFEHDTEEHDFADDETQAFLEK